MQFLATTYSPLVIAGMPAEQIFCFTRDEEGKVIQVKIESDMTMGRADQILTGELFGLKTTLDLVTQEKLEEYKSLLGKRSRTPEEEERFQELRHTLNLRIPLPYETPSERKEQAKAQTILLLQALSAVIDNDNKVFVEPGAKLSILDRRRKLVQSQ